MTDVKEYSIINLFMAGSSKEEIMAYCEKRLEPLSKEDKKHNTEYVKTLKSYLLHNNDLLHTAKDMYVHRNTMINRMKKINSLLGINMNDLENRNEFYNIFKVLEGSDM